MIPRPIQIVGFAAVVVWITASLLYVRAVASPLPPEVPDDKKDGSAFVSYVLSTSRSDRKTIDTRQRWANSTAVGALTITAVSFALLLFSSAPSFKASVALANSGAQYVSSACGHPMAGLSGNVTEASLSTSFVVVELPARECGTASTIRIPSSYVSSVRSQ